jgi:hypothetical protein
MLTGHSGSLGDLPPSGCRAFDLELMKMSETPVFFKSADGVKAVRLPANEALQAVRRHPHEWSLTRVFAEPPAGWVPSEGDGGGRGRVQGSSVRTD